MASSDAPQLAGAFGRRLALQGSLSCCWGFLAMIFADPTTGAATKRPAGLESAGEADAAGDAAQQVCADEHSTHESAMFEAFMDDGIGVATQRPAGSADAAGDALQLRAGSGDATGDASQLVCADQPTADDFTGIATQCSAGATDATADASQLSAGSADAPSDAAQLPADAGDGPPTPFQLRAEDVIAIQNADGPPAPAQEAEAAQNAEAALGPPCALGPPQLAGALDRRLARDCRSYTREEFVHFYGQDSGIRQWAKAPLVVSSGQIPSASAPASTAHTTGTANPRPAGSQCADNIALSKALMADGVVLFVEQLSF